MRPLACVLALIALVSCSAHTPGTALTSRPKKIPARLVFEKEISGRVLAYDIRHPSGVAVDAADNLYVVDTGNNRVIKFGSDLNPIKDYGGYGGDIGRFINPEDIVVDHGLNIYALDTGNRRIIRLDAGLNYVDEIIPQDDSNAIISNAAKLSGVYVSPLGEITVSDYDNSRLIKMDNFNRFSRYIGDFGYGRGALLNPLGIAGDAEGRMYVADAGDGRIAVYDDYGNYLSQIGADSLVRPSAVTVSPYGVIWVADQDTDRIYAFSPSGDALFSTGGPGRDEFLYSDIEALAVSRDGDLYVADAGNNRVMVYSIVYEGAP
jgi:tripartite motif-containing protein 71